VRAYRAATKKFAKQQNAFSLAIELPLLAFNQN